MKINIEVKYTQSSSNIKSVNYFWPKVVQGYFRGYGV